MNTFSRKYIKLMHNSNVMSVCFIFRITHAGVYFVLNHKFM
jgi:hypothetical protein